MYSERYLIKPDTYYTVDSTTLIREPVLPRSIGKDRDAVLCSVVARAAIMSAVHLPRVCLCCESEGEAEREGVRAPGSATRISGEFSTLPNQKQPPKNCLELAREEVGSGRHRQQPRTTSGVITWAGFALGRTDDLCSLRQTPRWFKNTPHPRVQDVVGSESQYVGM